jgi:hypothetical protein
MIPESIYLRQTSCSWRQSILSLNGKLAVLVMVTVMVGVTVGVEVDIGLGCAVDLKLSESRSGSIWLVWKWEMQLVSWW